MSEVKVDTISERTAAGGVTIDGVLIKDGVATFQTPAGSPLVFEGATANAFETTFAITDPTADRTITFPDSSFTVPTSGGLTYFSQWRLNTTFTNDQDPITANLEEVDAPVGFGKKGSSMTQSSGVYTFPDTGYWLVQGNFFLIQPSNGAGGNVCNLSTTIDHSTGPTWAVASQFTMGDYYGDKFEGSTSYIFDVTDTAECKVRFGVNVTLTDTATQGNTNENLTYFTFTKLADT